MILYDLRCANEHRFEAWFRDSATFDSQAAQGDVTCPFCGTHEVSKALMAPNVATSRQAEGGREQPAPVTDAVTAAGEEHRQVAMTPAQLPPEAFQLIRKLREVVEQNCDYVGPKFAEEARKIHYGETETRNIYGEATPDEAAELQEEGIAFSTLPGWRREDA